MADAYTIAKQHLDAGIAEAKENNIDANAYGQAQFLEDSGDVQGERSQRR